MQHLIEILSTKTINCESTGFNSFKKSKGLAKVTALNGLERSEVNYLFAIYLNDSRAKVLLKAHLVTAFRADCDDDRKLLKLVIGSIKAMSNNEYRANTCYKCGGAGCTRCDFVGTTHRKVKEYELCDIPKSTWYSKAMKATRELYKAIIAYMLNIEANINLVTAQN